MSIVETANYISYHKELPTDKFYDIYRPQDYLGYSDHFNGIKTFNVSAFIRNQPKNSQSMEKYHTINPVKKGMACIEENLAALRTLCIDVDCYKCGYDPIQLLNCLDSEEFDITIPRPTYATVSRGVKLFWQIDENKLALPKWKQVQRWLYDALKEYGADASCVNSPVKLTRIPGTLSRKNGNHVRLYELGGGMYTLYGLFSEWIIGAPYNVQKEALEYRQHKNQTVKKKNSTKVSSDNIANLSVYKLNMMRARDVEYVLNNHCDHLMWGRENCFFLLRLFYTRAGKDREWIDGHLLQLNSELCYPLQRKEVLKSTLSGERYARRYNYSNRQIIEMLSIPEDMMPHLSTIISVDERRRRERNRKKKEYIRKLSDQGKLTKQESLGIALKKLSNLLSEGKKRDEIMQIMHISRSTFYNYKQMLARESESITTPSSNSMNDSSDITAEVSHNIPITPMSPKKSPRWLLGLCPNTGDKANSLQESDNKFIYSLMRFVCMIASGFM